jgi:hypothetical protein
MSYSAFVNCNCDKLGKTSCEHEDNRIATEWLTNIAGMAHFRYAIDLFNAEKHYPILAHYLPSSNDGFIPVEYSQGLLEELLTLENERRKYEITVLFEEKTNEEIAKALVFELEQFAFTEHRQNIFALNRNGFFIYGKANIDGKDKYLIVFKSKDFTQKKISQKQYEFIDKKNGGTYRASMKLYPFEGDATEDYTFKTTRKLVKLQDEYGYIIDALKKLASASLETGNPICWL